MEWLTEEDPRSIGGYELRARLGEGGFGRVYLGLSAGGQTAAVRVLRTEFARDRQFLRRFGLEVAAAQRVSGAYTAPVVASGLSDRPPWLATAFVSGPSLAAMIGRHGPLPEAAIWRLLAGLVQALHSIHGSGLVHGNLNPANVILAADGPRVTDFGISRATDETATESVFGTAAFMAPEQAMGTQAGPASDVFAMGSVLAYAATGTLPFGSGNAASVLYRVVHALPQTLDSVPPQLRGVIEWCLSKDAAARPGLADLARFGWDGPAGAPGQSPTSYWPPQIRQVIWNYQQWVEAAVRTPSGSPRSVPPNAPQETRRSHRAADRRPGSRRKTPIIAGLAAVALAVAVGSASALWLSHRATASPARAHDSADSADSALPPLHAGTPVLAATIASPGGGVLNLCQFSPDGKLVACKGTATGAATINRLYVWNVATRKFIFATDSDRDVGPFGVSADDKTVTAADVSRKVFYRWDLATGKRTVVYSGFRDFEYAISADGNVLAVEDPAKDGVDLWNLTIDARIAHLVKPGAPPVGYWTIDIDRDGSTVAITDAHDINVWDVASQKIVAVFPYDSRNSGLGSLSQDGKVIVIGYEFSPPGTAWDVATRKEITPQGARWTHSTGVNANVSPDGRVIGSCYGYTDSGCASIDLWNLTTRHHLLTLTDFGHAQGLWAIGPNDSDFITAADSHGTRVFYLWDIP